MRSQENYSYPPKLQFEIIKSIYLLEVVFTFTVAYK